MFINYSYDQAQRVTSIQDNSGNRIDYTLDAAGNRIGEQTKDPSNSIKRSLQREYNALGLLSASLRAGVNLAFDLANNLTQIIYPSGATVNYTRDSQGRLITATLVRGATTVNLVTATTYLPFGPISSLTFGNGQTLTKTYDQNYDIDLINSAAINYDYATDSVGNITQIQSGVSAHNFSYDKLYRLTDVRDQANALIEAFSYDATGNRLTQQDAGGTDTYTYPGTSHKLSQVGATARTTDANGNTLTGVPGFVTDSATYDARNRLTQVGATGSSRYQANYNGRGERVLKSANAGGISSTWTTAGQSATVYDEGGQVLSYLRSGATLSYEEIVWFDTIPITRFTTSSSTIQLVHMIHSDHLNSPRALTNARAQGSQASGLTVWRWDLLASSAAGSNAFGSQLASEDPDANGTLIKFDLRFPGQQYDSETNLNYNYFRDYESGTGRYVESDPIGLFGGMNTFSYVKSNALIFKDPTGEKIWICNRKVDGFPYVGNHAYLWDDRIPSPRSCSMRGSSGSGLDSSKEAGPPTDECVPVPGSDGLEDEIMGCCKKRANRGPWIPGINDCHNAAKRCVKRSGLKPPPAPGGRFGKPCDKCDSPKGDDDGGEEE